MPTPLYYTTPEYLLREILVPSSLIQVTGSITLDSQKRLTLINDSITPGNSMYYGTNSSGVKGWYTTSGSTVIWGNITGTLTDQADLATALNAKQATLVSGTNIKTINGTTILGSGDLVITAGVSSVTGTTNRITSTGGSTPVIDIAATYVGQTSITILGTISTGVWQGTTVTAGFGGTGIATYAVGDILYASAATTLSKLADVAVGSYLRSGGVTTAPLWSTTTLPNSATTGDIMYATAANTYGNRAAVATGSVLGSAGTSTAPAYLAVSNGLTATATTFKLGGALTANTTISGGFSLLLNTISNISITQSAQSSAWQTVSTHTAGAHTSLTTATEFVSNDWVGATQTWVAGTIPTQRFNYFRGYTVAGATATNTITNAYTVYVDPPIVGTNASITNNYALGVNGDVVFQNNSKFIFLPSGSFLMGTFNANNFNLYVNSTNRLQITTVGAFTFLNSPTTGTGAFINYTQSAATAGTPRIVDAIGGAHTNLTLSTESTDVNFGLNRIVQFATGALTTQRAFLIQAPTYGFVAASTLSDAVTFEVSGAPIQGTNATITRSWAARFIGNVALSARTYLGSSTIAPLSTMDVGGSAGFNFTALSADTTLDATHYTVTVDASGANRTITLPAATGCTRRVYIIKKIDATANTVTIDGNGAETIDGAATKVINTQWSGINIQSNGTNWIVIAVF